MKKSLCLVFGLVVIVVAPTASAQLVITEIMYNPTTYDGTIPTNFGLGTEEEYVEIFNTTAAPIDVSGYDIGDPWDNVWVTIPAGYVIPAYGSLIACAQTSAGYIAEWGAVPGDSVLFSTFDHNVSDGTVWFPMSNSPDSSIPNEGVGIRDLADSIIDQVAYDDELGWPADSGTQSIFLDIPNSQIVASGVTDNDNGANWTLATAATRATGAISGDFGGPSTTNGSTQVPVQLQNFSIE